MEQQIQQLLNPPPAPVAAALPPLPAPIPPVVLPPAVRALDEADVVAIMRVLAPEIEAQVEAIVARIMAAGGHAHIQSSFSPADSSPSSAQSTLPTPHPCALVL